MNEKQRNWIVVLVALGLFVGGFGPLFLILDPLDLHLVDRLSGDFDAAALAVPPESMAYVGVNLLGAERAQLENLGAKFAATGDGGILAELGLSLEQDVLPWVGQYVGWALVDMEVDSFNQTAVSHWVLIIEARSTAPADDFLARLTEKWTARGGAAATAQSYEGVDLTVFPDLALGRNGRLLLISSDVATMQQSIDAKNGRAIDETDVYAEAVISLPPSRLLTVFVNGADLPTLRDAASVWTETNLGFVPVADIYAVGVGGFLVDAGIRLDMATTYDRAALSPGRLAALDSVMEQPQTAVYFPANTILYLAGQPFSQTWAAFIETEGADFAESMLLLGQQFGFDPATAVFPLLDGEAALGLIPGSDGLLAAQTGLNVEGVALLGTSQPAQAQQPLDGLLTAVRAIPLPIAKLTDFPVGSGQVTEVEATLGSNLRLAVGVADGYMVAATTGAVAQSLRFDNTNTLAQTPAFQQVAELYARENAPTFYLDVAGLHGVMGEGQAVAILSPIRTITANANVIEGIALNRIYLLLEK